MRMGVWATRSWEVIWAVHATLPQDATIADRKKALAEAYPFGAKSHFPYKAWCKARREYLAKYETPKPIPAHAMKGTLFDA